MERQTRDKNLLERFLNDIVFIVEKHARYIVVSGFVAIAHGRIRGTEDIDMIIERLAKPEFARLHEALLKRGFECEQSPDPGELFDQYLTKHLSVRYVRKGTITPVLELKFAKDELDDDQIRMRTKLQLTGMDVWFSTIETNIAFKEELLKSPKDIEDARHLRLVYEGKLNIVALEKIKKDIRRLRL